MTNYKIEWYGVRECDKTYFAIISDTADKYGDKLEITSGVCKWKATPHRLDQLTVLDEENLNDTDYEGLEILQNRILKRFDYCNFEILPIKKGL